MQINLSSYLNFSVVCLTYGERNVCYVLTDSVFVGLTCVPSVIDNRHIVTI